MKNKVLHYAALDDVDHWCECCGKAPKGIKVYIDVPKLGCNPAFWCMNCVIDNDVIEFEIVGWCENADDYFNMRKEYKDEK